MERTKRWIIITIGLIAGLTAAALWIYIQSSMTADVGNSRYEGAVFVEDASGSLYQAG